MFNTIIAVVIGYLLGSIPFAYIAGRLKKRVDIRQVGSGNVGALNVIHQVGTAVGYIAVIGDIAKGSFLTKDITFGKQEKAKRKDSNSSG